MGPSRSIQVEKRKFLTAGIGLFGVLPFFWSFSFFRRKKPYVFLVSLTASCWKQKDQFQDGVGLQILNDTMSRKKQILKIHIRQRKDEIFFLYVFDSQKSLWKWDREIQKNRLFLSEKVPPAGKYKYMYKQLA